MNIDQVYHGKIYSEIKSLALHFSSKLAIVTFQNAPALVKSDQIDHVVVRW